MRGSAVTVSKGPPAGELAWEPAESFHSLLTLHSCLVSYLPGGSATGRGPTARRGTHPTMRRLLRSLLSGGKRDVLLSHKDTELRKSSGLRCCMRSLFSSRGGSSLLHRPAPRLCPLPAHPCCPSSQGSSLTPAAEASMGLPCSVCCHHHDEHPDPTV